jgi:hypothetical protein
LASAFPSLLFSALLFSLVVSFSRTPQRGTRDLPGCANISALRSIACCISALRWVAAIQSFNRHSDTYRGLSSIVSDDFGTLLDIKLTQRRNVQLEPCRSAYARWRPSTVAPMFGRAWPNPLPNAPAISLASSLLAWAMLTGQKDALGSGGEEDAHFPASGRRDERGRVVGPLIKRSR